MKNDFDKLLEGLRNRFGPNPRIAIVCKGGPENGPFSAMAAWIITLVLAQYGYEVSAIYACSGSVSTGLLGCIGEFKKLCVLWANVTSQDIVGRPQKRNLLFRSKVIYRIFSRISFFSSRYLRKLIKDNWDLDRICSDKSLLTKFPAVDALSSEYVIFSNKNPKHKEWFEEGALGSKALIPFLEPQIVLDPEKADLIEEGKARIIDGESRLMEPKSKPYKAALLIDGGYGGNMLLEEAQRDGFNVVFLVDIHGLVPTKTDLKMKRHWSSLIRIGQHLLSNTNDVRQFRATERVNEEIEVKETEEKVVRELKTLMVNMPIEYAVKLEPIIKQIEENIDTMNNGRLRLGDKTKTQPYMVSNKEHSTLFNFSNFEQQEVLDLLNWGREAAINTLQELGFDTSDVPPLSELLTS